MKNIIKDMFTNKIRLIGYAGTIIIFAVIFYLYNLPLQAVLYPVVFSMAYLAILVVIRISVKTGKHKRLSHIAKLPAVSVTDKLPSPESTLEQDYQNIIDHVIGELSEALTSHEKKMRDTTDYYSTWVHQIKTPIASMRLHLQTMDSDSSRNLLRNLASIETYVDMVMSYLRLQSEHTDYIIQKENIRDIVTTIVRKFKLDFIEKKLSLKMEVEDAYVLTDRKWVLIVIEQILSNCLKYTKEGYVRIAFKEDDSLLVIEDTGIGIDATNLPRIFERGYTGFNGRGEAHSSGIGLYLVKSICDNLKIDIRCESQENVGTKMYLTFPKNKVFYE
ncbi:MAG: sensor histidine kinase [Lachnospiraceae bacterium]|nr:sensor histidine kinase [Lachnospiraceae bacterium]